MDESYLITSVVLFADKGCTSIDRNFYVDIQSWLKEMNQIKVSTSVFLIYLSNVWRLYEALYLSVACRNTSPVYSRQSHRQCVVDGGAGGGGGLDFHHYLHFTPRDYK